MLTIKRYFLPLALAVTFNTQGCATFLKHTHRESDGADALSVSYQPVRGGMRILVAGQGQRSFDRPTTFQLGLWGTALAGAAAAAAVVPYRSYQDAGIGALIGGLLAASIDLDVDTTIQAVKNPNINKETGKPYTPGEIVFITVGMAPIALPILAITITPLHLAGILKGDKPSSQPSPVSLADSRVFLTMDDASYVAKLEPQGSGYVAKLDLPPRMVSPDLEVRIRDDNNDIIAYRTISLTKVEMAAILPVRQAVPPQLTTKVDLEDAQKLKLIEAEYPSHAVLTVNNYGKGIAQGVRANLELVHAVPGLHVPASVAIGDLAPGMSKTVRVPLTASKHLPDGQAEIVITLEDSNGFDAPKALARFQTRALQLPQFEVEQVALEDEKDGIPEHGEQLTVRAVIRNKGNGLARDVKATLRIADSDILLLDRSEADLGSLKSGAAAIATYSIVVKNSYQGPNQLPLDIRITEAHPEATRETPVKVALHQSGPRIVTTEVAPRLSPGMSLSAVPDLSIDVDQPLETVRPKDKSAVAVIIGIERYNNRIPNVPFAHRDASMVREYAIKLLGVPEENVIFLANEQATKAQIMTALEGRLKNFVTPGRSNVYVYYAGHGAPDPNTKTPYLVPFDGDPAYPRTSCYSMDSFYSALKDLHAKSVTVMLDSCFSGISGRGESTVSLIADARPLFIKPVGANLPSGVTVLAAATGDQLSFSYPEKKHGLFTYFLLKGLRGDAYQDGSLTLGDLHKYLQQSMVERARRMGRSQTPVLLGAGHDHEIIKK